jgi:hypothetical protein
MGPRRGGAYTYDWIEDLMGLDMHSADRILPEFQDLKPGDAFALGEKGAALEVAELDPERALVFRSQDGAWVWSFGLCQRDGSTRLASRSRIQPPDPSPLYRLLFLYAMEPGSLVMERKMLLGIKSRAEYLPDSRCGRSGPPAGRIRVITASHLGAERRGDVVGQGVDGRPVPVVTEAAVYQPEHQRTRPADVFGCDGAREQAVAPQARRQREGVEDHRLLLPREAAPGAAQGSGHTDAERPQRPLGESVPVGAHEVLGGREPALTVDGAAEDDGGVRLGVGTAVEGHYVCRAAEFGQSCADSLGDSSGGAVCTRVADENGHHATSFRGSGRGVVIR